MVLWERRSRAVFRLSCIVVGYTSSKNDVIVPGSREYPCLMNLAAIRCTFLVGIIMCFYRCGFKTLVGVVLLVLDIISSFLILIGHFPRCRRRNPTDLLALLMIFWMCVSQESALVISIPRYFSWLAVSSTCPSMLYG